MAGIKSKERPMKKPIRKKGQERRQLIIDAAKKRLIAHGIEGLVLREVAESMNITHGNLQYYFRTKDDLLRTIFDEEVQKYTEDMKESAAETSTMQGRISAIVDSSLAVLQSEETKLWRALIGAANQSDEFAAILKRENDLYEKTLADELKFVSPDLPEKRRKHVAKIVRMVVDGFAVNLIYEEFSTAELSALKGEIKAMVQQLLQLT